MNKFVLDKCDAVEDRKIVKIWSRTNIYTVFHIRTKKVEINEAIEKKSA